jgi:hypothetical protein
MTLHRNRYKNFRGYVSKLMKKYGRQLDCTRLAALSIKNNSFNVGISISYFIFFRNCIPKLGLVATGYRATNEGLSAQTRRYSLV